MNESVVPMRVHFHVCPVCQKQWEHENSSILVCSDKVERCWDCWMESHFPTKQETVK